MHYKTTYAVRADFILDDNNHLVKVYGINAYQNGKLIIVVPDVFTDSNKIHSLVNLCNTLQLDVIHLDDVIEDVI